MGSGVILHSVMFAGSMFAVLSAADDDQPLLDVAFPDVTAKCRGVQVKAYDLPSTPRVESGPRFTKLSVWEGRRKGASGVGWGTGALVTGDGQEGLRKTGGPVEKSGDVVGAVVSGSAAAAAIKAAKAHEAAPSSSKPAAAATAPPQATSEAAATPAAAPTSASSPKKGDMASLGVRAPHHLPPMGGGEGPGLRPLKPLGGLPTGAGTAPWDKTGKPLGK